MGFVGFGLRLSAQVPNIDALQFEVASVKPNTSGSQNSNMQLHPGGRVTGTNVAIGGLLRTVFNLQPHQLVNAPDWIDTARFDIEAKFDREYSTREDALAPELLAMLRNVFADRFRLIAHREMRDTSVYALVKARAAVRSGRRCARRKWTAAPFAAASAPTQVASSGQGRQFLN